MAAGKASTKKEIVTIMDMCDDHSWQLSVFSVEYLIKTKVAIGGKSYTCMQLFERMAGKNQLVSHDDAREAVWEPLLADPDADDRNSFENRNCPHKFIPAEDEVVVAQYFFNEYWST